ncbi:hypothetical protein D3C80_1569370 [compost metagenome]
MLAGDAYTHHIAIKGVQRGQVLQQNAFHFLQLQRRQVFAGAQVMLDLAKDPWPPLGSPANQQAVGPGRLKHGPGLFWRSDIAIGKHWDRHRLLDLSDGVVLGVAGVKVGAGPSVYRQCLDPGLFGNLCHRQAVLVRPVPTRADFQRDRYIHGGNHRVEDLADQGFIFQ